MVERADLGKHRAAYRSDLASFGRWCAQTGAIPLTVDSATLIAFQAARQAAGDSASTIRRRWSALSSFYDFAVRNHAADANPALGADRPRPASGDPSPTARLTPQAVASYRSLAAAPRSSPERARSRYWWSTASRSPRHSRSMSVTSAAGLPSRLLWFGAAESRSASFSPQTAHGRFVVAQQTDERARCSSADGRPTRRKLVG